MLNARTCTIVCTPSQAKTLSALATRDPAKQLWTRRVSAVLVCRMLTGGVLHTLAGLCTLSRSLHTQSVFAHSAGLCILSRSLHAQPVFACSVGLCTLSRSLHTQSVFAHSVGLCMLSRPLHSRPGRKEQFFTHWPLFTHFSVHHTRTGGDEQRLDGAAQGPLEAVAPEAVAPKPGAVPSYASLLSFALLLCSPTSVLFPAYTGAGH